MPLPLADTIRLSGRTSSTRLQATDTPGAKRLISCAISGRPIAVLSRTWKSAMALMILTQPQTKATPFAPKFYDEKTDCLKRWWGKNKHVWLNPPYSFPDPFILKAIEQMEHDNQIDILLPGDNSTAWFRDAQKAAAEIIWIVADVEEDDDGNQLSRSGRLAFINGLSGKPVDNNKGSVIFIMRKLKPGEEQKTLYIPVSEICPSLAKKRMRKRGV
nr:DNA methyltransferase [Przondovirus K11]